MPTNNLKKSSSKEGNEQIVLMSEDGTELAAITIESIFENRQGEELDATNILAPKEVKAIKKPKKKAKRLESNKMLLIERETGLTYAITQGKIPEILPEKINMCMFTAQNPGQSDPINIIIPIRQDGTIPEKFPYLIKILPPENITEKKNK